METFVKLPKNNEPITAEQAIKESEENQLPVILQKIRSAVKMAEVTIKHFQPVTQSTIDKLNELVYVTHLGPTGILTISWRPKP